MKEHTAAPSSVDIDVDRSVHGDEFRVGHYAGSEFVPERCADGFRPWS